ncbi:MAG TPA: prepilin peptidase [Nanoarchaeota archaeon]|nr:prepilin peptidase [Nanoarchaeota archaeon]
MDSELIFLSIALLGTLSGSIFDIKDRWVPDWTNYLMVFFGLAGHAIISLQANSIWPFAHSLIAVAILYGVSELLFQLGVWGGGDAKMLIGLGALLATFPNNLMPLLINWPFLLTFWTNSLIFGGLLGFFGSIYLAVRHFNKFLNSAKKYLQKKYIQYSLIAALIAIPIAFFFDKLTAFVLGIIFLLALMLISLKSIEEACMFKTISPKKLVEGDWVTDEINIEGVYYVPNRTGIEKKDILKLIELENIGKLKNITVKEGLPYVPAFFLGLVSAVWLGDLMFLLVIRLFAFGF